MSFKGFTRFDGAIFPPELREVVPTIKTLAELKLLLIILDAYFQAGLDAQPMTFDQLQERTKLARQSVNDGLKGLLKTGYIQRLSAGDTYAYEPSLESRLPCHESSFLDSDANSLESMYDHAWQSRIWTTLVQEFGVASRVAEDIAFKRDPAYVQQQIEYARYEIEAGFQPKRLAGYIVARIRDDRPTPLGYKAPIPESGNPLAGLPPAFDGHQRAVDEANGSKTPDPVEEVTRHHYWGFMDAPGIELPSKKRERMTWLKAGERLLNFVPEPWTLQDVCTRLDQWWNDPEQDEFWKKNPCSDKTLILIAKYVKNGGNHAAHKPIRRGDEDRHDSTLSAQQRATMGVE